jgi:hypothetical protein
MVCDIDADFRYSLFGLVIGLQNRDIPLVTENLLKVRTRRVAFCQDRERSDTTIKFPLLR